VQKAQQEKEAKGPGIMFHVPAGAEDAAPFLRGEEVAARLNENFADDRDSEPYEL
jgi:hypothetical protein